MLAALCAITLKSSVMWSVRNHATRKTGHDVGSEVATIRVDDTARPQARVNYMQDKLDSGSQSANNTVSVGDLEQNVPIKVLTWNMLSLGLRGDLPFEADPDQYQTYIKEVEHAMGANDDVDGAVIQLLRQQEKDGGSTLKMCVYDLLHETLVESVTGTGDNYDKNKADEWKFTEAEKQKEKIGDLIGSLIDKNGTANEGLHADASDERLVAMLKKTAEGDSARLEVVEEDSEEAPGVRLKARTGAGSLLNILVSLPFQNRIGKNATKKKKQIVAAATGLDERSRTVLETLHNRVDNKNESLSFANSPTWVIWKQQTPLQWLLEDRIIYGEKYSKQDKHKTSATKKFALSQADKDKISGADVAYPMGLLQPFGCAEENYGVAEKNLHDYDWIKLRIFHLLLLAARNKVLYAMADENYTPIKGWTSKRLQVSHKLMVRMKEGRFAFFDNLREAKCRSLASQKDPNFWARSTDQYLQQLGNPDIVLLQEVDKTLIPLLEAGTTSGHDHATLKHYKIAYNVNAESGQLAKDNSAVLVSNTFLGMLGITEAEWAQAQDIKAGEDGFEERFVLRSVANQVKGTQLVVGTMHAGSSSGDDKAMGSIERALKAVMAAMNTTYRYQIGVFGGDLNVDPRKANKNGTPVYLDLPEAKNFAVHRLTNPSLCHISHAIQRGPFQMQMPKIGVAYKKSIDHIYVVVPKHGTTVTQLNSDDSALSTIFGSKFSISATTRNQDSAATSECGKQRKEFPDVLVHEGASITGYLSKQMQADKIWLPMFYELNGQLPLLGSDHLPVTAKFEIPKPASWVAKVVEQRRSHSATQVDVDVTVGAALDQKWVETRVLDTNRTRRALKMPQLNPAQSVKSSDILDASK
eukprot:gnl/MRDRNA2_/MRDRNA2_29690_c0_seq1.p1 gnl/MRDRNA2_/MRDRNA2_29690_c0~~gnl/MRDRNA2_/MRDRNA2_29690_c0_seq1.p1  ORF type:complete len:913 (-),score=156.12 gnl/MRDRNA2_/MRDRNA2_29690_c0_seq1:19-2619(-)